MGHLIKRAGHKEEFDSKKLYASIYASCLAAHESIKTAESTAELVTKEVSNWVGAKHVIVTSNDIRKNAGNVLNKYNPDAAYSYIHHRIIW